MMLYDVHEPDCLALIQKAWIIITPFKIVQIRLNYIVIQGFPIISVSHFISSSNSNSSDLFWSRNGSEGGRAADLIN